VRSSITKSRSALRPIVAVVAGRGCDARRGKGVVRAGVVAVCISGLLLSVDEKTLALADVCFFIACCEFPENEVATRISK
jgi:hypothetical protein